MKIYIDFDDVICETAKHFTFLASKLFGVEVPYSKMMFFNLQKTFGINDEQYNELMKNGHTKENLLAYEETEGASDTINKWIDLGHEISIITGRPFDAYDASRRWLDEHNLKRVKMYCVDKYGRESFNINCTYSMTLEQLYALDFDFVVEDSPVAFEHVMHFENAKVAVFNRPWNLSESLPNEHFVRCDGWKDIDKLLMGIS